MHAHPRLVVSAYPQMACFEGEHWTFVVIGIIGIIFYMVGLPVAITFILSYIDKNQLHTDRSTMLAFGCLYSKYRVSAWRYEIWQVCPWLDCCGDSNPRLIVARC